MTDAPNTPEPKRPEHPDPRIEAYLQKLEAMGAKRGRRTGGIEFTGDFVQGMKRSKLDLPETR